MPERVLILGAAGRDFHNVNVVYRNNPEYQVVGFTATQIPDIAGRHYPAALAGESYSDVPHEYVMQRASIALAAGADFSLLGYARTAIPSTKPVGGHLRSPDRVRQEPGLSAGGRGAA